MSSTRPAFGDYQLEIYLGRAVYGALAAVSALAALFLGVLLAG